MASINPRMDNPNQQQSRQGSRVAYSSEQGAMELVPGNSLQTATPEEGRQLAIRIARATITATQPDMNVQHRLREVYSRDATMLIEVAHVTAIEFQTIAAANNYWRNEN